MSGKAVADADLATALGSARISGEREHRGEIVAKAEWPAIVSAEDTARVRAILADPSRRTNRTARRYLLARLASLWPLRGDAGFSPDRGGVRRYVCAAGPNFSGCGHTYIGADTLELFVVEAVLHRLDSPDSPPPSPAPATARTQSGSRPRSSGSRRTGRARPRIRGAGDRPVRVAGSTEADRGAADAAKRKLARLGRVSALDGHVGNGSALREAGRSFR